MPMPRLKASHPKFEPRARSTPAHTTDRDRTDSESEDVAPSDTRMPKASWGGQSETEDDGEVPPPEYGSLHIPTNPDTPPATQPPLSSVPSPSVLTLNPVRPDLFHGPSSDRDDETQELKAVNAIYRQQPLQSLATPDQKANMDLLEAKSILIQQSLRKQELDDVYRNRYAHVTGNALNADESYHTFIVCAQDENAITKEQTAAFHNPLQAKPYIDGYGRRVIVIRGPSSNPKTLPQLMNAALFGSNACEARSSERLHLAVFRVCRILREYMRNRHGDIGSAFLVSPLAAIGEVLPFIARLRQMVFALANSHGCGAYTAQVHSSLERQGIMVHRTDVDNSPVYATFEGDSDMRVFIADTIMRAAYVSAVQSSLAYPLPHLDHRVTEKVGQVDHGAFRVLQHIQKGMRADLLRISLCIADEYGRIYRLCGCMMEEFARFQSHFDHSDRNTAAAFRHHLLHIRFLVTAMMDIAQAIFSHNNDMPNDSNVTDKLRMDLLTGIRDGRAHQLSFSSIAANPSLSMEDGLVFGAGPEGPDPDANWDWEKTRLNTDLSATISSEQLKLHLKSMGTHRVVDSIAAEGLLPENCVRLIADEYYRREVPIGIWRPLLDATRTVDIHFYVCDRQTQQYVETDYVPHIHMPSAVLSITVINFDRFIATGEYTRLNAPASSPPLQAVWQTRVQPPTRKYVMERERGFKLLRSKVT